MRPTRPGERACRRSTSTEHGGGAGTVRGGAARNSSRLYARAVPGAHTRGAVLAMWNPFRTEEHDFTTRLSIGDCRARLRVLLDPGFDVKAFTAPSLTSEPRRFAGEVSTFAFVLRRHIAYNNGMQVEARGALHVLPAGTLVHVRLG